MPAITEDLLVHISPIRLGRPLRAPRARAVLLAALFLLLPLALAARADAAAGDLALVSRADGAAGVKANAKSDTPAISADGRFVAFRSQAANLDPADDDAIADVFVRDLQTNSITLASRASGADGVKANGRSSDITLSADGRLVAFESGSTNLVAGVNAAPDVYVRDLQANTTTLVDRASGADGAPANALSSDAAISANGRFVAFTSLASNLSPDVAAGTTNVYVRDLQTNTTTLVSRAGGAGGAAADGNSQEAAISADGRFVAFTSFASNLDPADTTGGEEIFVRDLQTNTTTLVSRGTGANGAKANGLAFEPAISADGRSVSFTSSATNLDPADNDATIDIFVRDLQSNTTTLVSRATGPAGAKGNDQSRTSQISGDGRYVTFTSNAGNLDPDVLLRFQAHVYERDLQANTTTNVSRPDFVTSDASAHPAISADGRFVAFDSSAANLDPDDPDHTLDVYRRDVLGAADQAARISINDASLAEGNSGQTAFRFTVSLDQAQSAPVSVDFTTADDTATSASDYAASRGTVTFAPGETAKTVTVQVNGDTTVEPDETFRVNLSNPTGNATIADATGVGTIVNDDQPVTEQPSRISVDDVSMAEGDAGQTAFRFNVALDRAQSAPVTVRFASTDGSATAPSDYETTTGTVTFAPGETAKTVTVQVNGDTRREPNETFSLNLSNAAGNATIADGHAIGTIVNDDRKGKQRKFALGSARLNVRTGAAWLAVSVPGPGRLSISGPGVQAAGARVATSVRAAGTTRLLIAARGNKQRTLTRTGMVTITPKVTYTPSVGTPRTRSKDLRLEKR